MLYSATCKQSGVHVALKLYRKPRLSDLNWFQVGAPGPCLLARQQAQLQERTATGSC